MDVLKDPERNETKFLQAYADVGGQRVLEVGCGEGRLTWRYAASARRIVGIDLDRDGLRVASIERSSDLENVVSFLQADSIRLPLAKHTFDRAILAWSF